MSLLKAQPRYMQIINYYMGIIDAGKLREGDQMPTEEEIGELFKVSRITVRQALDGLCKRGYIFKLQGKGSFVSRKKTDMQLNHLIGFSEEMRNQGLEPSTRLIELEILTPSDTVAEALGIDTSQKVYYIVRLRCADGTPMAVERVHLPFYRFAGIENLDLTKSLYELLRDHYGCESSRATQKIQAGFASARDTKLLEMKPGTPVLLFSRTTYEPDGKPFEYVESVYRGDKYVFNVTLKK